MVNIVNKPAKSVWCKTVTLFGPVVLLGLLLSQQVVASVRLSNDWPTWLGPDGHVLKDDQYEPGKLGIAEKNAVRNLNAVSNPPYGTPKFNPSFRLHIDEVTYYISGAVFMAKVRPEEVCTVSEEPGYKCIEKQSYTKKAHLFFFNSKFEKVGFYTFKINEPYEYFVNTIPAVGVYNKDRNELLVTVQYFPIGRKLTSKISEVGSGWSRMTILFRVKAVDGRIQFEQDDSCLKNPNRIETIPDARKALKRCEKSN